MPVRHVSTTLPRASASSSTGSSPPSALARSRRHRRAALPYLQELYDHPQFKVRNLQRLWGGSQNGKGADSCPASHLYRTQVILPIEWESGTGCGDVKSLRSDRPINGLAHSWPTLCDPPFKPAGEYLADFDNRGEAAKAMFCAGNGTGLDPPQVQHGLIALQEGPAERPADREPACRSSWLRTFDRSQGLPSPCILETVRSALIGEAGSHPSCRQARLTLVARMTSPRGLRSRLRC
jgi:hypothetical protein